MINKIAIHIIFLDIGGRGMRINHTYSNIVYNSIVCNHRCWYTFCRLNRIFSPSIPDSSNLK